SSSGASRSSSRCTSRASRCSSFAFCSTMSIATPDSCTCLMSFEIIKQVHESGVAMLIVEQNANVSLSIADRGYVLSTGRLVLEGRAAELREDEGLRKAYLGR